MQIVTGRRGEPHVTSRQMQAVYRSFLGDFALLDIGEKLRAEAYSNDIVRVYDGVVSVQGIYAVIAYNQYDEVYIEPVSVGKKRIDTIVLHYTKDNALDVEDMQLDVVQGEEYTDNPIAPVVPEGGDAWEGTTDIQVPIYDVEVTNFGLTVTPYARMLNLIPTLDSIAERIPETIVTGVKGDSEVLYRDGDVNITKANIGLGNVDNTADTDKPISTATQTALAGKVDKVTGKGLSTEDYTTIDKTKLAGISEGATQTIANPADTATETLSKLEVGGVVYDVPQGASGATELSELTDVNLADVEDNNILQYDETANKWKNSNALQGSKTTTGNPITITDAAPVNAVNLSVDLEPVQDLHGLPYPYVGGAYKNKLPMTVEGIKAQNGSASWSGNICTLDGVSFEIITDNDGNVIGIKANRVAASSSTAIFNLGAYIASTGDILNGCPNGGGNNTYKIYSRGGATGDTGAGTTIASGDVGVSRIYAIAVFSGGNPSNLTFYPMIRLSTETATTFAPYTNICPISGRSEFAINRVGKNLWDEEWENGAYDDSTHTFFSGSGLVSKNYIKISPDKSYYFKFRNATTGGNCYIVYYDENKNFISDFYTSTDRIIDKPSNAKYIRFYIWGGSAITQYAGGICLNISDASFNGQYEPYAGKTYTIQLGQTVYGCHHDVTRGKMVVDNVEVDLGDLYFSRVTNATYGSYFYTILRDGKKTGNDVGGDFGICSRYPVLAVHWNQLSDKQMTLGSSFSSSATCAVVIKDDSYTNESTFNTMLRNENVQLVYELAEPFTIDLTPTQIKLLENTNTITTDYEEDTITIEYQPNNAIGEAVRAVEESYDPEFAVRPVLKKKAFSGTTDTDGSVTLINASDIPSGHKIIPLQITDMTIGGSAGTYFVEYEPYNSGDSVKGYCYFYMSGSQMFPVGKAITGNFYYYELEV